MAGNQTAEQFGRATAEGQRTKRGSGMTTEMITTDVGGRAIATRDEGDIGGFNQLVDAGNRMVKTGFLPDHIRTGEQFAAIVLVGREMGIPTMRAIRSLQIIKGNVTEKADSQLARFKEAGGRAQFEALDDARAVLHLVHPNGDTHTETWTINDSRKAGLTGGMHGKFPRAMIRSRCITAALKSIGWAGAVGNYDPDELRDQPPARHVAHEDRGSQSPPWQPDGEPVEVSPPSPAAGPRQIDPRVEEIGEYPDAVKDACRSVMRAAIDSGISRSDAIDQAVAHGRELLAAMAEEEPV